MKTAVSIPDDVYHEAERLAQRLNLSRSRLHADAVREYLAVHDPDSVAEAINRVCDAVGGKTDPAVAASARRLLERVEW